MTRAHTQPVTALVAKVGSRALARVARTRPGLPPAGHAHLAAAGLTPHLQAASLSGTVSGLYGALTHPLSSAGGDIVAAGLDLIDAWMLLGARDALDETAHVIGTTTRPQLDSTWFSSTYWRVAALAALLTVPFLFAAAIQALLRSDLALLLRAAFGYLPLALVAVGLAAPVTMLLLSATDEMCAAVSSASSATPGSFLVSAGLATGTLSFAAGSGFLAFAIAFLTASGALALALELLIREAAVYVVLLMLPLAFAALVWPARRTWAVRAVELLVALILSKFAIVAVLALADGAFSGAGGVGVSRLLTAMALVLLSVFSPWAMLRLLPFTELAASAGSMLGPELTRAGGRAYKALGRAETSAEWVAMLPGLMRRDAERGTGDGAADPTVPAAPERSPLAGSAGLGAPAPDPGSAPNGAPPQSPAPGSTDAGATDAGATDAGATDPAAAGAVPSDPGPARGATSAELAFTGAAPSDPGSAGVPPAGPASPGAPAAGTAPSDLPPIDLLSGPIGPIPGFGDEDALPPPQDDANE